MLPEPTESGTTPRHDANATRRQLFGLILTVVLGVIAGGASYFGTRDSWLTIDRNPTGRIAATSGTGAEPASEIELPEGPHRDEFQASCLICHSARLPLGQPPFGGEKWAEVVHKMVAVYGAPMSSEEEHQVVDYLLAARPSAP
jgi:hypothetical protein